MRTHLASLVEDFRHHAGQIAVVSHRGIRRYPTTYGELALLAGRFAAELDRRGVAPGDRVILWGANSAEWIGAFFGCLLRGAVAVPLDAAGAPEFAGRVVRDVAPKLIVGDRELLLTLAGTPTSPDPAIFVFLAKMAETLPEQPNFAVSPAVAPQSPFQIVFTSGTTSEPKGIVHTHRNVLASVEPIEREMAKYRRIERVFHPLRFLHTLPLSHVFGQFMCLWLPPLLAGEIHFVEQVEARRMAELIRRERISVLVAVPRVLQLLRTHLLGRFEGLAKELEAAKKDSKLSRWWTFRRIHSALGWKFWAVISGGAALPAELEEFWAGVGIPVVQGYGMTETTALVTLNSPFKIGKGTIGKTLPGREVRLSDEGEIQVRGDMLATATWSGGRMIPRQGDWLATGDLGERNEQGELRFLGRKDDVIVTGGGLNVYPADLESSLKRQPGIRECAVVPCETVSGTEPVAVVLLDGGQADLPLAVQAANRELAAYQQIRRVLVWPEPQFPYTSTGKLLRRKVAAWAGRALSEPQNGGKQAGADASGGKDILLDLIAEVTGEPVPGNAASCEREGLRLLEDFHLDSLGRVQLQTALEQHMGLEFEDEALGRLETLGQLRALVASHGASSAAAQPAKGPREEAQWPAAASGEIPAETGAAGRDSASRSEDLRALISPEMYPRWPWNWFFAPLRAAFLETVVRPFVWFLGAPRVAGNVAELPSGPVLAIANHVTAYDGALVVYALPRRLRRRIAIAMSGEMLLDLKRGRGQGNWFLNLTAPVQYLLVTALFNVFPMARSQGFRKSFQHAGEAMDRGYSVLIFPEGARYYEGGMRPFRPGIGLIAEEARVPVLPVALIGLQEMHSQRRWFRSGRLEIRIGEPIPVEEGADPAELTARFEAAVRRLCLEPVDKVRLHPEGRASV